MYIIKYEILQSKHYHLTFNFQGSGLMQDTLSTATPHSSPFNLILSFKKCCVPVCVYAKIGVRSQGTTFGSQSSPSTMWGLNSGGGKHPYSLSPLASPVLLF